MDAHWDHRGPVSDRGATAGMGGLQKQFNLKWHFKKQNFYVILLVKCLFYLMSKCFYAVYCGAEKHLICLLTSETNCKLLICNPDYIYKKLSATCFKICFCSFLFVYIMKDIQILVVAYCIYFILFICIKDSLFILLLHQLKNLT